MSRSANADRCSHSRPGQAYTPITEVREAHPMPVSTNPANTVMEGRYFPKRIGEVVTMERTIEIKSPLRGDLIIPQDTRALYNAANGPLIVEGNLINLGLLQIVCTDRDTDNCSVRAESIHNSGTIESTVLKLTLDCLEFEGRL